TEPVAWLAPVLFSCRGRTRRPLRRIESRSRPDRAPLATDGARCRSPRRCSLPRFPPIACEASRSAHGTQPQVLLADAEDIVHEPVENQTSGEIKEHEGEDEGHEHHHPLLRRVALLRCEPLLQEHACTHEKRQHRDAEACYHESIRRR